MSTIVTRAGKGSALTHNEVDANFVNLNTDKAEKTVVNTFTANQIVSVTDNTNAALRITQLGSGDALLVEDSTNPDSSPFVIDAIGQVGIGGTATAGSSLRISKNLTGASTSIGVVNNGVIQTDATVGATMYRSTTSTVAASFTLPTLIHYQAGQGTIGATSAVTNQYGYAVDASLTGATNNYGFFGNIASGTNRYNLYMNGTADNYIAGNIGFGTTAPTGTNFRLQYTTSAAVSYVIDNQFIIGNTTTTEANGFRSVLYTQAAAFTLIAANHFSAVQVALGAGSAITTQSGFRVEASLTGATNNYGFYGNIASGTNRFNLYMAGTAANRFNGDLLVYGGTAIPAGGTAGSGYKFSSTANFGVFFGSGAPTLSAAKGSLYLRSDGTTTNNRMYVNTDGATTWTSVTTAA